MGTVVLLSGCSTEIPYTAPWFAFSDRYEVAGRAVPVLLEDTAWWEGFRDSTLDALVAKALSGNLDLAIAKERITEAQANLGAVAPAGNLTPSADVRREKDLGQGDETRAEATLGLSWLIDPYGARFHENRAARARIKVADAETDAARLLLLLNLSNAYIDLRYNQAVLGLRREQLGARQQTLALTQQLFDQNSATRLDLVRSRAQIAQTQAQIPALEAAILSKKNRIAVLTGVAPGRLGIELDRGARQPRPVMSPKVGIPADLLRNRPDIRIQERLYYASVAQIGVAQANLYPKLSLGGSIGHVSLDGRSGGEYYFGPALQLPPLFSGDRKAAVAARYSQARQTHASWKSTVLSAIEEVESAQADYAANALSLSASRRSAQLYREAASLTRDLVRGGGATIPTLLSAQDDVADADIALAETLRNMARSYVALNVSLGAGNAYGRDFATPTTQ
ncbi:MAG: efflux transporter outer membrane subunit [Rhodobacteraceae bacterium]|nr:efflux transporter outer membrane subunit [Paracoccaceae bacterium]